jgi:hypothetical protein
MRALAEQEPGKIKFDEPASPASFRQLVSLGRTCLLCEENKPVAFLEEKAREMGLNAMHLEFERGDEPALELYRRGSRSISDDKMAEPRIAETFHRAMPLE